MHYHRWYRHGDVVKVGQGPTKPTASNGRKYRRVRRPGHPLASTNGQAYEHRIVLWELRGCDPMPCHYCGRMLVWFPESQSDEALQVDHLNDHSDDNRPENLVPCCASCNTAKGQARRHRALVDGGWWSRNDTVAKLATGRRDFALTAATSGAQPGKFGH